jgi:hypothetical protein
MLANKIEEKGSKKLEKEKEKEKGRKDKLDSLVKDKKSSLKKDGQLKHPLTERKQFDNNSHHEQQEHKDKEKQQRKEAEKARRREEKNTRKKRKAEAQQRKLEEQIISTPLQTTIKEEEGEVEQRAKIQKLERAEGDYQSEGECMKDGKQEVEEDTPEVSRKPKHRKREVAQLLEDRKSGRRNGELSGSTVHIETLMIPEFPSVVASSDQLFPFNAQSSMYKNSSCDSKLDVNFEQVNYSEMFLHLGKHSLNVCSLGLHN